uniref:Uncharacterized protein n=1 Tax=Panagrolaimus sp. PS1159 TaxID=55785 RepID=A0AC35GWX6_9BILA
MASAPPNEVQFLTKLFECLLHIVYGSCFALFPFTFIFTIPAIKKRYRFRGICNPIDTRVSPQQEFIILSVTGKRLFHESTPKAHFMSLQQAWDMGFDKKGT